MTLGNWGCERSNQRHVFTYAMSCRMWTIQERSGRSLPWPYFPSAACASLPPHILTARVRPRSKPNPDCRPRLLFIGGLLCARLVLGGDCADSSPVKCLFFRCKIEQEELQWRRHRLVLCRSRREVGFTRITCLLGTGSTMLSGITNTPCKNHQLLADE